MAAVSGTVKARWLLVSTVDGYSSEFCWGLEGLEGWGVFLEPKITTKAPGALCAEKRDCEHRL